MYTYQGIERIAVRYFFKRIEIFRYGIMAEKYESESRKEHVFVKYLLNIVISERQKSCMRILIENYV